MYNSYVFVIFKYKRVFEIKKKENVFRKSKEKKKLKYILSSFIVNITNKMNDRSHLNEIDIHILPSSANEFITVSLKTYKHFR